MQLLDLDAHLGAQQRVEVRQRLVEQERLGLAHDRAPHRDALALPAGELARLALEQVLDLQDFAAAAPTRVRISSSGRLRSRSPNAMFSSTVLCGYSA